MTDIEMEELFKLAHKRHALTEQVIRLEEKRDKVCTKIRGMLDRINNPKWHKFDPTNKATWPAPGITVWAAITNKLGEHDVVDTYFFGDSFNLFDVTVDYWTEYVYPKYPEGE